MIPALGFQQDAQGAADEEGAEEEEVEPIYQETLNVHQSSIFKAVTAMRGPKETLDRLKAHWTTLGLVSALLMTFTFPAIYNPPIPPDFTGRLGLSFQICNSASSVISACVVILATILSTMTDWMCSNDHMKDYIVFVSPFHESLILLFLCSLLLLCGAAISITWLNASQVVALFLSSLFGIAIVVMILLWGFIFLKNFRLLEQYVDLVSRKRATFFVDKLKLAVEKGASSKSPSFQVTEGPDEAPQVKSSRARMRWLQGVQPGPQVNFDSQEPILPGGVAEDIETGLGNTWLEGDLSRE